MERYAGPSDILSRQEEFSRAMWCPEVESARKREAMRRGAAESELSSLKRFATIRPRYDNGGCFALQLFFDRHMLGEMAGGMDQVKDYMWALVEEEITKLFRARRSA